MANNPDLVWALQNYDSDRQARYAMYRNYYHGVQKLAFATEKFRNTFGHTFKEFAENACVTVVDALADRLSINSFSTNEATTKTETMETVLQGVPPRKMVQTVDPLADSIQEYWDDQIMPLVSGKVHEEAIREGDSYVIVWPDDQGVPKIWPQYASQCCIQYDAETKVTLKAAKIWWDEVKKQWFLNLYYPDQIVKWVATKSQPDMKQGSGSYSFPDQPGSWASYGMVPNPYGIVPVFHFANGEYKCYGTSALENIIPLQNGLNKSDMDMMIAMEFASFKQRYVIGLELEIDEQTGEPKDPGSRQHGVDRLMAFADPDTKVGQFEATDLEQFLKVQDKFWISVSRVSGTPLHYFFISSGDFPSGEAMKAAELRFTKRITDCQIGFGAIWEEVLGFCLKIQSLGPDATASQENGGLKINIHWKDAVARTDNEIADTAVKKKNIGVSRTQLLIEQGYTPEQIQRMLQESDMDQLQDAAMKATLQSLLAAQELGMSGPSSGSGNTAMPVNGNRAPKKLTSGTQGVENPS